MDKIKSLMAKLRGGKPKTGNKVTKKPSGKPELRKRGKIITITLVWCFFILPWVFLYLMLKSAESDGLPSTKELENPKSLEASEVISLDGEILGKYYAQNRTPVTFAELSPYLIDALISTEDERFYDHAGVDEYSIPRVIKGVLSGDQSKGGGSTISQQLAKMLFSERDFSDMGTFQKLWALVNVKLKEWILAVELERKFTKEEIITMYFNKFDFLHNAVGIHSAAQVYFNKPPDSLKIEEAALLVGMCKNPSYFNPRSQPERTQGRRNQVLLQWLKNSNENNPAVKHKLSQSMCDSLMKLPVVLDYQEVDHQRGPAPYFREILREAVVDTLANMYSKDITLIKKVLSQAEYSDFLDSLEIIKEHFSSTADRWEARSVLLKRWAKYMLYNKGLKIYTTIDSRMQRYGEWAVKEWLSTTLQDEFEKQQRKRLGDEYPFDLRSNIYYKNDRDSVITMLMNQAMRRSERWLSMKRAGMTDQAMIKVFRTPVDMKVFSWKGDIDTVMSPLDSIRYYKQFMQAGLMAMDPHTGYVKAWVGGADFYHFKYDHVIKSRRQVGSTFKPFVYATGIDMNKITPCTKVPNVEYCVDIPHSIYRSKSWCPKGSEYDGEPTSMKFGLAGSMNNITAYVMREVQPINVVKRALDMGIDPNYLDTVPALALGIADLTVYEMVGAQSTFVNKGLYIKPIIITRIEDKEGNVIYDADPKMKEVFAEEIAYITLQLMKGVMDGVRRSDGKTAGTAAGLRFFDKKTRPWGGIRAPMAGKTGTTQNGSDGWFIGLTPDLVTGVWVGAEDRAVHFPTLAWGQGGRMALPIYGYFMQKVYEDKRLNISQEDFERPSVPIPGDMWNCDPDENDGDIDFGGTGNEEYIDFEEGIE